MTWYEFTLYNEAHDRNQYSELGKLRQIMFTMVRLWGDPKKAPASPMALWPLPTDPKPKEISPDEIAAAIKRFSSNKIHHE